MNILNQLLAQPGFTPPLLIAAVVMYGAWTYAYYRVIRSCCEQKSYGVPMVLLCLNIVWECIFAFNLAHSNLAYFFRIGNGIWFFFDIVMVYQFFRYGREAQVVPFLREHFLKVAVLTLFCSAVALFNFTIYFNDIKGVTSSMTMNLTMSVLYILMLFHRPDMRGLDYRAAWAKMFGTAGGSVFLYFWWPKQFNESGLLLDVANNGAATVHQPEIHAPYSYTYMLFLYLGILFFDLVYIYLLTQRRKAIAQAGPKVAC